MDNGPQQNLVRHLPVKLSSAPSHYISSHPDILIRSDDPLQTRPLHLSRTHMSPNARPLTRDQDHRSVKCQDQPGASRRPHRKLEHVETRELLVRLLRVPSVCDCHSAGAWTIHTQRKKCRDHHITVQTSFRPVCNSSVSKRTCTAATLSHNTHQLLFEKLSRRLHLGMSRGEEAR
jgi:hypothetical protein